MRITGSQVGPVNPAQLEKLKKAAPAVSPEAARPADQVVLSRDVSAIEAAKAKIAETADVREDKVEALRREIQQNTYHVSAVDIADKILAESRLARITRK